MNRECNNRVRNGQYRVWGVPKNIYNLGMIFSAFCLDTMLPKGTVLVECGKMLQRGTPKLDKDGKPVRNEKGKIIYESYKIRVFNTINFQKSMHFNPFAYIHSEKDILKIVTTLIANTKGEGKAGDDFWVSATRSQTIKSLRTSNGFPLFGELVV